MQSTEGFTASNGVQVEVDAYESAICFGDGDDVVYMRPQELSALREYFHAELSASRPMPWHEAGPWETWVLTIDGVEHAVTLDEECQFRDPRRPGENMWLTATATCVVGGRRIWPEADEYTFPDPSPDVEAAREVLEDHLRGYVSTATVAAALSAAAQRGA